MIAEQPLDLHLGLGQLVTEQQFIIPRLGAVAAVYADVARGGQPAFGFALPFEVAGRASFVVEVACEGEGETLVQAPLVEVEGFFEGVKGAGEERGSGEDDAGADLVGLTRDGRGGCGWSGGL